MKDIKQAEDMVIYYGCSLPKDHKFYRMLREECESFELRSKFEEQNQNCSPDYMGGCN